MTLKKIEEALRFVRKHRKALKEFIEKEGKTNAVDLRFNSYSFKDGCLVLYQDPPCKHKYITELTEENLQKALDYFNK